MLPRWQGSHFSSSVCPQNRRFCFIQCHNKLFSLILPFLKYKSLMSFLPSHQLPSRTAVCARKAARTRGTGRKVGTLIPQIGLLSPYGYFQLLLVSPTPASSFPAPSICPVAASGKSQPLSGEPAGGRNWSLSSIRGAASRAG